MIRTDNVVNWQVNAVSKFMWSNGLLVLSHYYSPTYCFSIMFIRYVVVQISFSIYMSMSVTIDTHIERVIMGISFSTHFNEWSCFWLLYNISLPFFIDISPLDAVSRTLLSHCCSQCHVMSSWQPLLKQLYLPYIM